MDVDRPYSEPEDDGHRMDDHQDDVFDVRRYGSNYSGRAKIDRLFFVARQLGVRSSRAGGTDGVGDHSEDLLHENRDEIDSDGLSSELIIPTSIENRRKLREVLGMIIKEVQRFTLDTNAYREACEMLTRLENSAGNDEPGSFGRNLPDPSWILMADAEFTETRHALTERLSRARAGLIRDEIRQAYTELGDLYFKRGDFAEALRQYLRTRDFASMGIQVLDMCLQVVKCSLSMRNFLHVNTYATKAETLSLADVESKENVLALSKLRCASALTHFWGKRYYQAAKRFTTLSPILAEETISTDIVSPADIAIYGTLCALASMARNEVSEYIVENSGFHQFLSKAPEDVSIIAHSFYSANFKEGIKALDRLRFQLSFDCLLENHLSTLLSDVRSRALTQYMEVYETLDLHRMADIFDGDLESIENEVAALIASGKISARIDSCSKTLRNQKEDTRLKALEMTIKAAENYVSSTKRLLLCASLVRHDMVQRHLSESQESLNERSRSREQGNHSMAMHPNESVSHEERAYIGSGALRIDDSGQSMVPTGWSMADLNGDEVE